MGENTMSKKRYERLRWFLDFIYLDLEKCSRGDLAKIIIDLDDFVLEGTKWSWGPLENKPHGSGKQKFTAQGLITPYEELPVQVL